MRTSCEEMKLDLIIKKNDIVPYDGILVDEVSYRYYQNEISAKHIYEQKFQESQTEIESDDLYRGILIGVIGGLVGGLALDHFIINH